MKKIALEEHFMCPSMTGYWTATVEDLPEAARTNILGALSDFGERRLAEMDAAGIERAVLSLAGPGVQIERDPATAVREARLANDFAAETVRRNPTRYSAFAHLPMQSPLEAAAELKRCVQQLGMIGALINGQTHGVYLDDPRYDPFWAMAEELGAPVYLHPADPEAPYAAWSGYKELTRATWGWTVETATHTLRMVFGGVFDRFPGAKLVLGHMGETLPYLLWRLDSRAKLYKQSKPMSLEPSQYIRRNVYVTTSGQCAIEPLRCALEALGEDRVMFAVDYPFESTGIAGRFLDEAAISETARAKIGHRTAQALFRL
jgi:2,3-dihydroxybenzoate decarboxylase